MCTTTTLHPHDSVARDYQAPVLSNKDLQLFNLLEHPIWLFNVSQRAMTWANMAGVELWDAKSLTELQARSFQDMSESTVTRLKDYQTNFFLKGEKVKDQWTYYPNGVAKTVQVTVSGIQLEGSDNDIIMLNEGAYVLQLENAQETQKDALRGVEMLRHLPISVTQFDIQGNVLYQNPESQETFGTRLATVNNNNNEEEEKTEPSVCDFLARFVDQALGEQVLEDVQAGKTVSVEANQITHKKGVQWNALKLRKIKDPVTSQPVILYSARDITDIMAAKREKEVAGKKSEFLAIMAHEIRTPLHQVTGFIDLLAQTQLDLEQRSFVKLLQSSAHSLIVVINDVLDYSKLEAGKMKLESIPFEPQFVVEASMDAVRQNYESKNLRLELQWDNSIPYRINGDSNRLRQVLLNLLSNAHKFTDQGGVAIQVGHHSYAGQECNPADNELFQRGVLKFSVQDSGVGISQEHKSLIFEEYQQATASVARTSGGTGLGLSICKKLVQNMGGTIGVDSEVGRGSAFWFTLPYEIPEEIKSEEVKAPEPVIQSTSSGLNVLVAEDNLVNQKLLKSMLRRMGHTSKVVENGELAVDEMLKRQADYDLILMDLQMPVMDGFEATERLRNEGFALPIYALTASVQRTDFADLGFNDWLGKPITMKIFQEKLQTLQTLQTLV